MVKCLYAQGRKDEYCDIEKEQENQRRTRKSRGDCPHQHICPKPNRRQGVSYPSDAPCDAPTMCNSSEGANDQETIVMRTDLMCGRETNEVYGPNELEPEHEVDTRSSMQGILQHIVIMAYVQYNTVEWFL